MSEKKTWAIVVALPHETKALLSQISVASKTSYGAGVLYQGSYLGQDILLLQTGMGPQRAAMAMQFLLAHHPFTHLWITGYCGGLSSQLKSGDAMIATELGNLDPGEAVSLTPSQEGQTLKELLAQHGVESHLGLLVQSKDPVRTSAQKKEVYKNTGALAVDMESYSLLKTVSNFEENTKIKIASFVLRFVVDTWEDELADTDSFVNDRGKVRPLQLAGEMLKRPRLIKDLTALEKLASKARAQLAKSFPLIVANF